MKTLMSRMPMQFATGSKAFGVYWQIRQASYRMFAASEEHATKIQLGLAPRAPQLA
jgi:hypothetical protein